MSDMSEFSKRSINLSEVIDIVRNAGSDDDLVPFEDDEEPEFMVFPPIKSSKGESDCDSDASDLLIICQGTY